MNRNHWIMVVILAVIVFEAIQNPASAGSLVTQVFESLHKIFH